MIFARATTVVPITAEAEAPDAPDVTSARSPAALASRVRRPARLALAERELAGLRKRREELRVIEREALAGDSDVLPIRRIRAVADANAAAEERAEVDAKVRELRAEIRPLRVDHAEAVRDAVAVVTVPAAQRALDALADLREAVAVLDEAGDHVRRAGGEADRPSLFDIGALEYVAAAVVRRGR